MVTLRVLLLKFLKNKRGWRFQNLGSHNYIVLLLIENYIELNKETTYL